MIPIMLKPFRKMFPGLAAFVLAGPWAIAAAMPEDDLAASESARAVVHFEPAIDVKPVPGFKRKMRGERIVYCRTERKIGTRIASETCIDQAQMPAYFAALEENRELLRQSRTGENRIN
jgi:hypothetical protein